MKELNYQIINTLAQEIENCNLQKIKDLIVDAKFKGFDFNTRYNGGKTLLHLASIANISDVISLFVEYGVNPNLCDERYNTPLHEAISLSRYQIVRELLQQNVDINIPGEFEQTPLHCAVITGNIDIVKLLVNKGVDIMLVDEKNHSPLDYALDEKNYEIYNFLKKEIEKQKEN